MKKLDLAAFKNREIRFNELDNVRGGLQTPTTHAQEGSDTMHTDTELGYDVLQVGDCFYVDLGNGFFGKEHCF